MVFPPVTAKNVGSLDVIGKIEKISIAVSATTILELTDVVVIRDLSHPLNLSLRFLKEYQAQLNYSGDQPSIQIRESTFPS
ncbi:MAG: hypothetical protein GY696_30845 [Gammaproteobacteria bacterium]|nr:hypothetical protein [Gammaproteobacteria bacterium]